MWYPFFPEISARLPLSDSLFERRRFYMTLKDTTTETNIEEEEDDVEAIEFAFREGNENVFEIPCRDERAHCSLTKIAAAPIPEVPKIVRGVGKGTRG